MKLLMLIAFFMSASFASEVVTFKKQRYSHMKEISQYFKINTELGRAWVVVKSKDRYQRENFYDIKNVKVEGLSYSNEQIIFENESGTTVCAEVNPNGGWRGNTLVITPTGNCALEQEVTTETYDDGFELKTVRVLNFNLVLK